MVTSPELAAFHYKSCHDAIAKYKAGEEDSEKLMKLCSWLTSFRRNGIMTDAQISKLTEMLGVDVEVPDAADTYEDELAAIRAQVSEQAQAIEEQGQTLSDHDDAIAELGEVVSELTTGGEEGAE